MAPVIYINLPHTPEGQRRRKAIMQNCKAVELEDYFFSTGLDRDAIQQQWPGQFDHVGLNQYCCQKPAELGPMRIASIGNQYYWGQLGHGLSMLRELWESYERGEEALILCEDDTLWTQRPLQRLDEWGNLTGVDLIHLHDRWAKSGRVNESIPRGAGPALVYASHGMGTAAILWLRSGIEKMMAIYSDPRTAGAFDFVVARYCPWFTAGQCEAQSLQRVKAKTPKLQSINLYGYALQKPWATGVGVSQTEHKA